MTLSGRVDDLETNVAYLTQDLLTRPTLSIISSLNNTWNNTLSSISSNIETIIEEVNILQALYSNLYNMSSSGVTGDYLNETFETINKNLKQYPGNYYYNNSGELTGVHYTISDSSYINKVYYYNSGILSSITLTGNPLPSTTLTKLFYYSGEVITGVSYS